VIGRARLGLSGRVVAVTGGGRGIGLEIARCAAARGAVPALLDVDGELAARSASELGGEALGLRADVTDLAELEAALAEVAVKLGGIDVLVANAGIGPRSTTVDSGDRDHQRRVLDVNLHGVLHTIWAGGPEVVSRRGHVVIISSVAAFTLSPAWAAYAASKAAVEQLARSMRIELAPTGATVGVAHFGVVDTSLMRDFSAEPVAARLEARAPAFISRRVAPRAAAEALVEGIERRAPRTIYPRWWRSFYSLRGVLGPLSDAIVVRDPVTRALMVELRASDRSLASGERA
jgi:NAD(P)-dependent dehydrogenase (short-subunit alcohol dehydrogenase family)